MTAFHSAAEALRETSTEAFNQLRAEGTLGEMQQRVLFLIARHPDSTARELTRYLVDLYGPPEDSNRVRPRLSDLVRERHIEDSGRRICTVSGMLATTWRIRLDDPQRSLF